MPNTTHVEVAPLRYVQCAHHNDRSYYYFRRRHFPIVRLPGEPGSKLFMRAYSSALAAASPEQLAALRSNVQQHRRLSPLATAIMTWAERKPITLSQATMVAKRFGVTIEEIVRGREVVHDQ